MLKGTFTLELSTSARARSVGATLKGRASRLSTLRSVFPDLIVDWADALALAKGASTLFLNARDRSGRLLQSSAIDHPSLATAEIEVAMS